MIDALTEVEDVLERPALVRGRGRSPRPHCRPKPLIASRPKTILPSWTVKSASPTLMFGGSTSHAEPSGVVDVLHHDVALVAVLDLAGQQRGHELGGVMTLQVGGLVAELGVGRRVRIVNDDAIRDEVVLVRRR